MLNKTIKAHITTCVTIFGFTSCFAKTAAMLAGILGTKKPVLSGVVYASCMTTD